MQRMIGSVLAVAEKAGVTSLAMPLLGCGLAAWPIPLAAKAIIQEVLNMAETGSVITTVKVRIYGSTSSADCRQHVKTAPLLLIWARSLPGLPCFSCVCTGLCPP